MTRVLHSFIVLLPFMVASCGRSEIPAPNQEESTIHKTQRVRVVIDKDFIATMDPQAIIEPVWFSANIYGSYGDYEASLKKFSHPQRLVHAMSWHMAEVYNGGHWQFYSNATGIVWEDAQKGFKEIGIPEAAAIIAESAKRMGGDAPFDRDERNRIMQNKQIDFADLDGRFYSLNVDIDAKMMAYIRAHAKDFLFDGVIEK